MRIDQEPGRPVGRTRRRHGDRHAALLRHVAGNLGGAARNERAQLIVEAVGERKPQHEQRHDVLRLRRGKTREHIASVLRGIEIEPGGIAVEQRARLGRQIGFVARGDVVPDAQELDEIIIVDRAHAVDRGKTAPRGKHGTLNGEKIVFRMGIGQAERGVGVAAPGDVRHAETVAHDGGIIFGRRRERGFRIEPGKPGFMRPGESEERQDGEHDESNYAAQDHAGSTRVYRPPLIGLGDGRGKPRAGPGQTSREIDLFSPLARFGDTM